MWFISKSINRKLIALVLAVTLIPLFSVTTISVYKIIDMRKKNVASKLDALRVNKERAIIEMFDNAGHDSKVFASLIRIAAFLAYQNSTDPVKKAEAEKAEISAREYLVMNIDQHCPGILLYSAASNIPTMTVGNLIKNKDKEIAADFANSKLESLCKKIINSDKTIISDIIDYNPISAPAMFVGSPVKEKGVIVGALLMMLNVNDIDSIMLDATGLEQKGETFLVGEDGYLRSSCRKMKNNGKVSILKQRLNTSFLRNVFSNDFSEATESMNDSHGDGAIVSCKRLELKTHGADFEWAIFAEHEINEIMIPVVKLIWNIVFTSLLFGFAACLFGFFVAKSISKPLITLSNKMSKLSSGNLAVDEENTKRGDELGILILSFNRMLKAIREQTQKVHETTIALASSIVQISAAVSELAANSAETSTSVTEISTTMEEVKQTTHVASERATYVSENAIQVREVSQEGEKATRDAVSGMSKIKDEMGALAESIVKLSGQTQRISEIINTVGDLAEQSNLLAVNAAIEAAKAGEFGKGFAVVAQEIKSLADQSKTSTRQVAAILNEIQQATSSSVMATERGSKAVESGVKLSETAGEAITALSASIADSADASSQIAASGHQQLIGIDQLAIALDSIREATQQNLHGIQQLEEAASGMKTLSEKLRSVAELFKI